MNPQEIISRLGVDAVLLPIREGTKAPSRKGWQNTTFLDTQHSLYQSFLAKAPAIGVLLGEPSQGLCSIDFDCPVAREEFRVANPLLQGSLTTTGKRGANVWVIVNGTIPGSRKLTSGGNAIGEWRAKGNHTIIAGKHPDGCDYSRIVDAPPVRLSYEEIVWPWIESEPPSTSPQPLSELSASSESSECSECSEYSTSVNPLYNMGSRIRAAEEALKAIKAKHATWRLYKEYVMKRFSPAQGKRNSDLIAMVTFLFNVVSNQQLEALTTGYYDLHQDMFTDPREQTILQKRICAASTARA